MRSVFLASLLALCCAGSAFAGLGFWDDEFTVAGSPSQKSITGQAVAPFRESRQVVVWTSFGTSGDGYGADAPQHRDLLSAAPWRRHGPPLYGAADR